jgi:hypothetical protein
MLTELLKRISWIPIQHAAKAVVEVRNSRERYMHLIHPHPVPMADILSPLSKILGLPLVPYSQWLESLEAASLLEMEASINPAVHLLDFFRSYSAAESEQELLSNTVALESAPSLLSVAPLTAQDAGRWMVHLRRGGYLA